jgi:hypothetical protein
LLLLHASYKIAKESYRKVNLWQILILPAVYTGGTVAFASLAFRWQTIQLLIFLEIIFLNLYLRAVYLKTNASRLYKQDSLENFSAYGSFLSVYFVSAAMFGYQAFLSVSIWPMLSAFFAISAALSYQFLWANGVDYRRNIFWVFLISMLMLEFAWVVSLLPVRHAVAGLLVAVLFYVLAALTRFYVLGRLSRGFVRAYLSMGLLCLLLALASASWI